MPPLVPPTRVGPGWHQIEADVVVEADGTAAVCKTSAPDSPKGPPYECAPDAQVQELTVMPFRPPGRTQRLYAPVIIHVTDDMTIDAVHPLGGTGGPAAPDS